MEIAHQDALIALAERAERAEQALQEFTDAHRDDALIALAERAERAEQALQEFTDARRDDALHILFAHFKDKADEFGVYFFDPEYYETVRPFDSQLKLVTNYVDDPVSALFTG